MEIKEKVLLVTEVVSNIVCNICGNSCPDNFAELKAEWGYNSQKDLEIHLAHICEECYDTFTSAFKHPPLVDDYNP